MKHVVAFATGLTIAHVAFASLCVRYRDLSSWDSGWYGSIVNYGYYLNTPQANVAFFPGFPVLAWIVTKITRLESQYSLPLTAQLACIPFWIYYFLLCRRHATVERAICVVAFPSAFFLVAGYSESTFLSLSTGYIYWLLDDRPAAKWIAALHGFGLAATRAVGLPLCLIPLLIYGVRGIGVTIFTCAGTAAYFAYCAMKFGNWHIYSDLQRGGWSVRFDPWALFVPSTYWANEFAIAPAVVALAAITWAVYRRPTTARWALIYAAWVEFLFPLVSTRAASLPSMFRYDLVAAVFACLAIPELSRWWVTIFGTLGIVAQAYFVRKFASGTWVG